MQPKQTARRNGLPLVSVTPLYGLQTDADTISIDDATINKISEEQLDILSADDVFVQHIRLYQPQHLLWKTIYLSQDELNSVLEVYRTLQEEPRQGPDTDVLRDDAATSPALLAYVAPVAALLRSFQLFKPGRFVAGDTSFFVRMQEVGCRTLSLVRCSEMSIDYQFVQNFKPHYVLNSAEVPFFHSFVQRLDSVSTRVQQFPQIELAMHRYCKESAQYGEVIDLMISLESLLVPEEEGIAFRLSQRVANLLGGDAPSRKELFKQIRDFYGLRSRIVHGAKMRSKEISAAQQVDTLREITRRVLLSVAALATDFDLDSEFYASLNEMCFDDDFRRSVQTKASALLHC